MTSEERVARILLKIGAVKLRPENPFTWASGRLSPIYCDNRILLSYPQQRDEIKTALLNESKEFDGMDCIAGVATAGIAHGALLADALNAPFVYVRSKAKEHGRQNLIEGRVPDNARILVVEDLISTGGSSMAAVSALRNEGFEVNGLLSIFTYGLQESIDRFKAAKCYARSLTNYDVLVEMAIETDYISSDQRAVLSKWKENPVEWSEERLND